MGRPKNPEGPSTVISIRLSPKDEKILDDVIALSEEKLRLAPGTITRAAFVRSAVLKKLLMRDDE
jgi:hypothetical protein